MSNILDKNTMEQLMQLNIKIAHENDFGQKIVLIAGSIKNIINADRCSIFVHDKKSKSFWTVHSDGISYLEIPDDKGIISDVYRTKQVFIDNDVSNNQKAVKSVDFEYITKSIISMPVLGFDQECIGVVQLLNKNSENGFDQSDVKVLQFVLNHFTTFLQMIVQENQ
ncbi:MAG: GAF domain-containing protein [Campylobacterota bacterium]|nr:GAF domain-containing protein [Campylobacterota bacterium]